MILQFELIIPNIYRRFRQHRIRSSTRRAARRAYTPGMTTKDMKVEMIVIHIISIYISCVWFRKVYVCPVAGRRRVRWVGVDSVWEGVGRMGEGVQGLHSVLGFRLDGLREGAKAGSTQAGWQFRIVPKIFSICSINWRHKPDDMIPFHGRSNSINFCSVGDGVVFFRWFGPLGFLRRLERKLFDQVFEDPTILRWSLAASFNL